MVIGATSIGKSTNNEGLISPTIMGQLSNEHEPNLPRNGNGSWVSSKW